ncbi:hypothetical protein C8J57DRAFT_1384721 [Mycena rebaudengoi]|nr:hypothetical protein C8J57DRAFT_1396684 [Mycena rebaudengoi]KAJ7231664.1 hypothetical protein C8J57DRAFT_1384721 [Mycena rebaudengoi]
MATKSCYMLVMPSPYGDNRLRHHGDDIFYVKFGDGGVRDAYHTHNPCFGSGQNDHASTVKQTAVNYQGNSLQCYQGKVLEWTFLKTVQPDENSEWHRIKPGPGQTYDQLRTNLQTLMTTFQNIRWVNADAAYTAWDNLALDVFLRHNVVD